MGGRTADGIRDDDPSLGNDKADMSEGAADDP